MCIRDSDWSRERFTMDEGCSAAVRKVFVDLYEKGLIYQGNRIINWCPNCKTALSDVEVEYTEKEGRLWHIEYKVKDSDEVVVCATTRPETMLGDTGIAVNPNDKRYTHLVGKTAILPLVGREIPIFADDYVEMEFGTGCVKVTPSHDPDDFEMGQRHGLDFILVIDENGRMTEGCGKYAGMDRYEARRAIVEDLEAQGLLRKVEELPHNVGVCYRCGTDVAVSYTHLDVYKRQGINPRCHFEDITRADFYGFEMCIRDRCRPGRRAASTGWRWCGWWQSRSRWSPG